MADASVTLSLFAFRVAMFRVALLIGCVQIACIHEMDGDFGELAHPRREGVHQHDRDVWVELAH